MAKELESIKIAFEEKNIKKTYASRWFLFKNS